MEAIQGALSELPGVSAIYTQSYTDTNIEGLPTKLGTKDTNTLEQTMVAKSMVDGFWSNFYQTRWLRSVSRWR
ncbi:AttF / AttG component of AttEFGH ABC transport system [Vibrio variabilis]|uniref:AttF / AttG component of AttEFGH ABC transport system n=1 Tax=Vibrio variabilis TaxID=990271 RepID=A0ABQ0JRE6_9VIBR|nr:AttF / AttG component of AttEFGH ABC transport system [Vibrio variabilis]